MIEKRRAASRPESKPDASIAPKSVYHTPTARGVPSLLGMTEWLTAIGHTVQY